MAKKIAEFLNLLDSQGRLSITNLAVLITLIKLAISPSASITEAGALLVALGNYAHKRFTVNNTVEPEDHITPQIQATQKQIDDIVSQVASLSMKVGIK